MSDDVPGRPDLFANVDAHLETIDTTLKTEQGNLAKLVTFGIDKLVEGYHSGDNATDVAAAVDGLLLSYLPSAPCWRETPPILYWPPPRQHLRSSRVSKRFHRRRPQNVFARDLESFEPFNRKIVLVSRPSLASRLD